MSDIIKIEEFSSPELDVYARLTGAQLRSKIDEEKGIFIAESPTVIGVALDAGCEPISILTDEKLLSSSVADIMKRCPDVPVYVASRDVLTQMTGFELTRGALSAMKRPRQKSAEELLNSAKRIAILEAITDSTNIGALFRSAAALGIDAVLVSPTCCDPLSRRAIRVSMGTVFLVPWARIGNEPCDWPQKGFEILKKYGFKTAAMALSDDSVNIDNKKLLKEEKLAIILGTEGTGLLPETISQSDYTVKIPMANGVDSLNVAAAGAIAFWQITR